MAPSWQKTTCDSDKTTPQPLVAKNLHLSSSSLGQSRNQQTDYLGMDPEPSACKLKNKTTTRSKGIKIKPKRNGDRILGGRKIRKHPSFPIKSKLKKTFLNCSNIRDCNWRWQTTNQVGGKLSKFKKCDSRGVPGPLEGIEVCPSPKHYQRFHLI